MLVLGRTKAGRDTALVFSAQFGNAVLGLIFNILLIRMLSTENYGIFILVSSLMMLVSGIAHFGWVDSYVPFGSNYLKTTSFKAIQFFFLKRTLICSAAFCLVMMLLTPWIQKNIYLRSNLTYYMIAALLGAFFSCIYSFIGNDYRVKQKFKKFSTLQLSLTSFRIVLCLLLLVFHVFTLKTAIAVLVLTPLGSLFLALKELDVPSMVQSSETTSVSKELKTEMWHYNKWIFGSIFMANIIGNIDSHIIAHYHANETLSAFGAAGRLTLPIQFMISALTTTMLPKLSANQSDKTVYYYLSSLKYIFVPITILIGAAIAFAPPLLIWVAGSKYHGIETLLRLQIFSTLIVFLVNPVGLVLYAWGWSKWFTILNALQLVVDIVLDLLWIPKYGAIGAVLATATVNLIGLVFVYSAVTYAVRKRKMNSTEVVTSEV
jgi:O-antigen/teichoic acid export membrane protein